LRVAYLSSDLRDHPVGKLTASLFKLHDRGQFHVLCFQAGLGEDSALQREIKQNCDSFQILPDEMTDVEVASAIHKARPHIIVELNALTRGGRHGALAMRPAPLQISFLGSSGPTGMGHIDYIVADRVVAPPHLQEQHYIEPLIRLPNSFLAASTPQPHPGVYPHAASTPQPHPGVYPHAQPGTLSRTPAYTRT
ncbi:hypothetical protein CYMTET_14436, partial [Cymbomonas tetramitiformis]